MKVVHTHENSQNYENAENHGGKKRLLTCIIVMIAVLLVAIGGVIVYQNIAAEAERSRLAQEEADRQLAIKKQKIAQIIITADRTAAMYDYANATSQIKTIENWQDEPELVNKIAEYEAADAQLITYTTMEKTTHVFFHSMIVDNSRAFSSSSSAGYNQFMTTISEFKKMLESFYAKGYVLVSMHDIAKIDASGTFKKGTIRIPKGKKPMVISQDDVNYYYYMQGTGFADKIVIGENGKPTVQYTDAAGKVSFGEYDLVTILDNFIEKHPDFSYHGNKALLALTGYNGVLGWRTQPSAKDVDRDSEIAEAKKVAEALKQDGYEFASHGWGHIPMRQSSVSSVLRDNNRWNEEVRPIVGDTDIFVYPHGEDLTGTGAYSGEKFTDLYAKGFRYFANVDASQPAWVQIRDTYVRQARRNLDGYRMFYNPNLLKDLFDVKEVWDNARPTPVPPL